MPKKTFHQSKMLCSHLKKRLRAPKGSRYHQLARVSAPTCTARLRTSVRRRGFTWRTTWALSILPHLRLSPSANSRKRLQLTWPSRGTANLGHRRTTKPPYNSVGNSRAHSNGLEATPTSRRQTQSMTFMKAGKNFLRAKKLRPKTKSLQRALTLSVSPSGSPISNSQTPMEFPLTRPINLVAQRKKAGR